MAKNKPIRGYVEILWDDLSEQGRKKLCEATGCDMGGENGENWDAIPLFIVEFESGVTK